jgi:hypothetical protein
MPVEDMDVYAWTRIQKFGPRKGNRQFKVLAKIGEMKHVSGMETATLPPRASPESRDQTNETPMESYLYAGFLGEIQSLTHASP